MKRNRAEIVSFDNEPLILVDEREHFQFLFLTDTMSCFCNNAVRKNCYGLSTGQTAAAATRDRAKTICSRHKDG